MHLSLLIIVDLEINKLLENQTKSEIIQIMSWFIELFFYWSNNEIPSND